MASFTLTPVEKGIMRCRHTGEFTHDEIQTLANFFNDYHGKLLVELSQSSVEECKRHMANLRPMMPTSAIFGVEFSADVLDISESYYTHPVKWFLTEEEALVWLREQ